MTIVLIGAKRRSPTPEDRRKQFAQDTQRFIEQYCADHQEFLRNPREYYRAQLYRSRPGVARGFSDDGWKSGYTSPYDDRLRFRKWEAVGGYRNTSYEGDGIAIRSKGYSHELRNDGNGDFRLVGRSRAEMSNATMLCPIKIRGRYEYPDDPLFFSRAKLWRGYNARATRFTNMPVEPPLPCGLRCGYATVKNIRPSRSLGPFLYGEPRVGSYTRPRFLVVVNCEGHRTVLRESGTVVGGTYYKDGYPAKFSIERLRQIDAANEASAKDNLRESKPTWICWLVRNFLDDNGRPLLYRATDVDISHWREERWKTRRQYNPREWRLEPWCNCEDCQRWYQNRERSDWRTDRKMRDLNARLNLYRYGDSHWQPDAMQETTKERLHDARKEAQLGGRVYAVGGCGGALLYFWPEADLHPSIQDTEQSVPCRPPCLPPFPRIGKSIRFILPPEKGEKYAWLDKNGNLSRKIVCGPYIWERQS